MVNPLPRWIDSLSPGDRQAATQRFLLRLAALHATESGTVAALEQALGRSRNSLTTYIQKDSPSRISVALAIEIEGLAGRAVVPREALLPEIFAIPE